jgi:hypothetical protein
MATGEETLVNELTPTKRLRESAAKLQTAAELAQIKALIQQHLNQGMPPHGVWGKFWELFST